MVKPYKAPPIRQGTDVIVEPKDEMIEPALARTASSRAARRSAEKPRGPGHRRPPNADTPQGS